LPLEAETEPADLVVHLIGRYRNANDGRRPMITKPRSRKVTIESTVTRPELLVEGSDRAFRQLVHDTLAFSARLQQVRGQLGQVIGLSGTQYTVLIAIAHLRGMDERVGVNLVAEHLHFSGAFITIEINKLVAAGLVEKETDTEDRRRVILGITQKARALLNELAPVQRPANDLLFSCLSAKDFSKIRKLMSALVETADQAIGLLEYTAPAAAARSAK
jgi:MarR family transcriptional regulator, organic hydroperoxide resistance regulator